MSAEPAPPPFDAARLIAGIRRQEPEALRQAYALTFNTEVGRIVLAHFLAECGVGQRQGTGATTEDRHYAAGRHDAAIDLAAQAGFDGAALAVAVLTDGLTEERHNAEPESDHQLAGYVLRDGDDID